MTDQVYMDNIDWVERGIKKFDLYKMPVEDFIEALKEVQKQPYTDIRISAREDQIVITGLRRETKKEVAERLGVPLE